jgi:hypothetical protein
MANSPNSDEVDTVNRLSSLEKRLEYVEEQFHFLNRWMSENLPFEPEEIENECRFGTSRSVG